MNWITEGIRLQLQQFVALLILGIGKLKVHRLRIGKDVANFAKCSESEKSRILTQQSNLGVHIAKFNRKAASFIPGLNIINDIVALDLKCVTEDEDEDTLQIEDDKEPSDDALDYADDPADAYLTRSELEDTEDSDDEDDLETSVSENDAYRSTHPESQPIALPSALTTRALANLPVRRLAREEAQLREAMANEALEGLRLALGHKAVIFRTQLRHSRDTSRKTKAWDNVKLAERKVCRTHVPKA